MSRKNSTPEILPPKVPGYIVTFSDMVTLLLTFFVMLLTLANDQDPELFNKGRDSFIKSINYIGLGMFFGRQDMPVLGELKTRHYIAEDEDAENRRIIDAEREKVQRIIRRIAQFAVITPSEMKADRTRFLVANVRFAASSAELDKQSTDYLDEFSNTMRSIGGIENIKIYVLGLAPEEPTPAKQWQLSARRAKVVADCLNKTLGPYLHRPVYSWGAGPGGNWVHGYSSISEKSHILVALLKSDE
ncbi:MAG: OmpA family protein [Sedimentisphaerales bacterium]|nr:OmpA family protein [Sedimentisphaerales bacterium]